MYALRSSVTLLSAIAVAANAAAVLKPRQTGPVTPVPSDTAVTIKEATLSPAQDIDPAQDRFAMHANVQVFGLVDDRTVSVNFTGFYNPGGVASLEVAAPLQFPDHSDTLKAEFYQPNATVQITGFTSKAYSFIFGGQGGNAAQWNFDSDSSDLWNSGAPGTPLFGYKYLKTPQTSNLSPDVKYHDDLYNAPRLYFTKDYKQITDVNGNVLPEYHVAGAGSGS